MYCPSCDKSYGAIHSRCPECHSWLKVSAPSSQRAKNPKTGSVTASAPPLSSDLPRGAVGTLDREADGFEWSDPAPNTAASGWSGSGAADEKGGWNAGESKAAIPAQSAPSTPTAPPKVEEWADSGGGWGGDASIGPARQTPTNGWLDTGGSDDGWSGGGLASEPPISSTPAAKSNGWLGDPPPAKTHFAEQDESSSGWLGNSAGAPASTSAPSGSGWLGEGADQRESSGGRGWLGDTPEQASPSMTEMVDHAIGVQEDNDFVDDSWVDEEIRDNEFDELDVPEFVGAPPEAGGVFLKMLLVAVLVVLVGVGVMFLRSDSQTPEEIEAESIEKRLTFGRLAAEGGKADFDAGKASLAIPQFQEALVALAEGKAPKDEIYDTEVFLGRALMSAAEYEEAHKHWSSLKASGEAKYVEEANKGLNESKRQLRIGANEYLKEAKQYAAKNEINSVKRLGRDALDIYQAYGGNQGQIGDAHGVIGRGFLNGREYAVARDHFKKAVALAPSLGYQKYLAQVNRELQPANYIPPIQQQPIQTSAPRRSVNTPSFDLGSPNYQRGNRNVSGGARRSSSNNNSAPSQSSGGSEAAPSKMKEIPIYRPAQRNTSGGKRPGEKNVLQGY